MPEKDDSGQFERVRLNSAEMDEIAERAATKALDKVYAEIGQSIARKAVWLLVLTIASLALWLAGKNALLRP